METIKCNSINNDEFIITRTFNVPREFLWKTLTTEYWKSWWMPKNYKLYEAELYPGGKYLGCMEQPEGKDFCIKGEFHEVIPNEKLVMTDSFTDRESIVAPADYYGMTENWPKEMLISITFDDFDGKTMLTLKYSGLKGSSCSNIEQGLNIFFDKLDDAIKNEVKGEKL